VTVSRRIPTIATIVLLFIMIGGSLALWDQLPDRMPLHFGIDGRPDSWGAKTIISWFLLPAIATGLTILIHVVASLIIRRPEFINMPDKKRFLELPPEQRVRVIMVMQGLLQWVGVMLNVTFLIIQFGSYRAAVGHAIPGLIVTALLIATVSSPLLAVVALLRMQSLMKTASRN
jgi:uncharacterized membrane protein